MKWIFALLFLFSVNSFAVEFVVAPTKGVFASTGKCSEPNGSVINFSYTIVQCQTARLNQCNSVWGGCYVTQEDKGTFLRLHIVHATKGEWTYQDYTATKTYTPYCPPADNPQFTIGPTLVNSVNVCQKPPKICMMGAIVRVASDGKETCVSNCSAATGLIKTSQFYYQAGPDVGSTAGQVQCYGQCAVQTSGGYTQLSNGSYTGTFAFTGANCPVVRPEPTVDSESNTGGNGDAPAVDESTTSEGTDNALGELAGAASSATGSQVQPSTTGPDGTSTLKDVAQTVADAANAQIQATSSQNVATGNLIANTTKDLQNTIIRTGSAGATSVLQAQGNSKLDGIGSAIGEGNGKLDGIKSTLDEISDKLDEPGEETPFVPGAGSGAFWESILPESSFTEIKDKQAQSIQDMKDLASEFQTSIQMTDLSASGNPDEWVLNMHGTAMPFGMGAFQMILDMGLAAVVLLLCALYAVYIIANRK
ncbi:hypothetical protein [Aeromonas rivipollensis]|uniref:hypothetical protein n=1 Tax=Aeromonas rivipollensis TaxID=948519 RepID=UPI0038D070D8